MRKSKKPGRKLRTIFHRPPPGSSPGTVVPLLDANTTTMQVIAYDEERTLQIVPDNLPQITGLISDYKVTWIQVVGLQDISLVQDLCNLLGIHRLTVEDIFNQTERPKVEFYEGYTAITIHAPLRDGKHESIMISVIMGNGFVVTFQNDQYVAFDGIRSRVQKKIGQIRAKDCEYLTYAVIDTIVDLYFPISEHYAQVLDTMEEEIINGRKPSVVLEIYSLRSRLSYFHRILWSHKELLNQLIRDPESTMSEDTCVYLRDCFDHSIQIIDFLENLKDTSKTLIDLHLSLQSHRANEIMKFLTIVTATFIPMTFVTGLYGMNFDRRSPWNMPELDWEYGYPFALGLMFLAASGLWLYFYRQNWFTVAPATKQDLESEQERVGP